MSLTVDEGIAAIGRVSGFRLSPEQFARFVGARGGMFGAGSPAPTHATYGFTPPALATPQEIAQTVDGIQARRPHFLSTGKHTKIEIGPGVIRRSRSWLVEDIGPAGGRVWRKLAAMTDLQERGNKRAITGWTAASRRNMVRTLASLDYRPLFERGGVPALVTLTYPGRSEAYGDRTWEAVAPTAADVKNHLESLQARFQHAYGYRPEAVWKMEFQRRGAPHFHLLLTPPRQRSRGDGLDFPAWLALHWASITRYEGQTTDEFAKTLMAATQIDYERGLKSYDPKRVAAYFSKHGVWSSKEYQNHAPERWIAQGSVGRFWGRWRLKSAMATMILPPQDVDPDTGEILATPDLRSPIMHIMSE
ncbi:hypothetical protein [Microbacterium sp. 4NA327F11]|uniref:rolling circle replication-associated protein n=1 Tax=Microbacterium sp. 4NA327F11 TaxID=2502229 RepID=UPI0010F475E0|nr:hypothetical protein [Microbacterium sp. 4NA327F11]